MNIVLVAARSPRWANPQRSQILMDCQFAHLGEQWVPFTASSDDPEAHGRDIFARAKQGEFGPIAPYVAPALTVPTVVTMRQARLVLLQAGLLPQIEAAVQQAGAAAQIEWEYATELRRDHPLTQSLSTALGLTEQQLDELFTQAAAL